MTTLRDELAAWFDAGREQGADWMLVVVDEFDHEDYPVYTSTADYWATRARYDGRNMQAIMESYDLHDSRDEQVFTTKLVNRYPPLPTRTPTRTPTPADGG